ncbi:hypothetical protein J5Y03_08900 [Bacillus sp. RG28]|uniref:Surface layer protein A domain-containing protein n=1 Tax=Gottfriedia endophytica TaxID=2820819 RepID=A0A940NJI5_9BACI|nr:hypothetical protein [Gottfriedia endophytica]MBP0725307.1 hypothetical protein [Gottfriedia endophytica]
MKKLIKVVTIGALSVGLLTGITTSKAEASTTNVKIKAGTEFSLSPNGKFLQVQDSTGKTINAKTLDTQTAEYDDATNMLNGNSYETRYIDYDPVYNFTVSSNAQAFTAPSTKKALTGFTSKGKKINIQAIKNTKLSKVNSQWFKGIIIYTDYKKSGKKWVKQTKSSTVYITSNKVKIQTTWIKLTKKVEDYVWFKTWTLSGATLEEYKNVQIGMSYAQVIAIFGIHGTLDSSSSYTDSDNITTTYETYTFDAPWGDNYASLDFENGILTNKYEMGLK